MDIVRHIALLSASLAEANIGVQEVGINSGASVEAYQQSCVPPIPVGSPWCAAHVRYRQRQAARQLGLGYDPDYPRSGYCPDYSRWHKAHSLWIPVSAIKAGTTTERPQRGDLALFYFRSLARIAHIGIVTSVHEWGVWTIEGNTSPEVFDVSLVEREGDGVYAKRRDWHELGYYGGFGQVNF